MDCIRQTPKSEKQQLSNFSGPDQTQDLTAIQKTQKNYT